MFLFKSTFLCSLQVMFFAAMHAEFMHDHKDYGFTVQDWKFDWP